MNTLLIATYIIGALVVGIASIDKVIRYKVKGNPFEHPKIVVMAESLLWPLLALVFIVLVIVDDRDGEYDEY